MEGQLWEQADERIDRIADLLDEVLDSPACDPLRAALSELAASLQGKLRVSLSCVLDVCREEHEVALPLLNTGIAVAEDGSTYRCWNDSLPQRYVVDGNIRVVPHDRCPNCWNLWDFKWLHRTCPHCPTSLGDNCRVLLDSDVCPHCEQGHVSSQQPKCDRCGWEVDPRCVVWGRR